MKFSFETIHENNKKEICFRYGDKLFRDHEYFICGDGEICVEDGNEWHKEVYHTDIYVDINFEKMLKNVKGETK